MCIRDRRDTGWFAGLASQNGARWAQIDGDKWLVNIDDAPTEEVAKYWQNLIDRGLVANMQGFSQQWNKALADGKLLTWVSAVWGNATLASNVPTTSGKWALAPMPTWKDGEHTAANWGGSSTAVPVSYTHLDVYKRQDECGVSTTRRVGGEAGMGRGP